MTGTLFPRALAALALVALVAPSPTALAQDAPPLAKPAATAEAAQAAVQRGVAYLLAHQNADGSFGRFESGRTGEIYLGTQASHRGFQVATSALCAQALARTARTDAAAAKALDRAVAFLVQEPPTGRAKADTFYDTWAHVYLLEASARLADAPQLAARREALLATAAREVAILGRRQAADGGYGYYDFGHGYQTPSGDESTSFLSAAALLAFDAAQAAGVPVAPAVIADTRRCLTRLRLPSGAYVYGTYAELRPGALFNWPKGSLGRSQPCNLALLGHGATQADLEAGLAALREHHRFIAMGRGRPKPHEAWYYTAGYYYLFGHYYAARVTAALEATERRAEYTGWLRGVLIGDQDPDGAWLDFPLYGYGRAYGTAYAVLGLEALEE